MKQRYSYDSKQKFTNGVPITTIAPLSVDVDMTSSDPKLGKLTGGGNYFSAMGEDVQVDIHWTRSSGTGDLRLEVLHRNKHPDDDEVMTVIPLSETLTGAGTESSKRIFLSHSEYGEACRLRLTAITGGDTFTAKIYMRRRYITWQS